MLMGVGDGTKANVYGDKPWIDNNPLTPNEAYFQNVDSVIQYARENDVIFSITLYHQRYRKFITVENARAWARWLASRYKDTPNIFWSMTPQAKPEFVPVLRELAAGLHRGRRETHVITFKPDPSPYTSSFIHEEPWLDFNSMQTWKDVELIYPIVTRDYNLKPVKPVLMAEGAYEQGSDSVIYASVSGSSYGFEVTDLWVRRQAYYSYLLGSHHTYGHCDSWLVLPTWKEALYAPGAAQMGVLKQIFLNIKEWWYLVPDQAVLASGGKVEGQVLNLAARHKDGKWALVYLADKCSFEINIDRITVARKVKASWIDPRTGAESPAGSFSNTGVQAFSTPEGWEDALLKLEAGE